MTLTANPDSATTPAGTAVTVAVLANDTLDGSPVALGDLTGPPTIVTPPAQGTATPNPDGTITYTPPAGFCGQVTFEYQIEAQECSVYANNVEAWGGSGNASNLQRAAIGNIPAWLAAAFDNGEGIEITFEGETEATYYETDGTAAYYVAGPNPSGPVSGVAVVASSTTGESSCLSYYIPEGS